jgi:polar amino acid transport system substrate-binding protein
MVFTRFKFVVILYLLLLSIPSISFSDPIKIVMPEEFRPYTFLKEGKWTGIDLEINQELYKRMGVEVVFESVPWARQIIYTEKGLAAGLLTSYCEDKKDYLEIAEEPFYTVQISLLSRKTNIPQKKISSLAMLPKNSSIGVIRASFLADSLDNYPQINPSYTDSTSVLIAQLFHKRVDYVLEELIPFKFFSKKEGYSSAFTEVFLFEENAVCAAYSKKFFGEKVKDVAFRASNIIKQLKAEGFIDQVMDKYIK